MTAPLANQANVLAFVVSGKDKAAVVKQILEDGPNAPRLPAQLIQPVNGELRWLLDRDAAAQLKAA
jgi:6-phosphogluconolactonase